MSAVSCTDQETKKNFSAEYEKMEKCLYKWFLNQREKKNIPRGPVLKAKAKSIFSEVYPDKDENAFTASNG